MRKLQTSARRAAGRVRRALRVRVRRVRLKFLPSIRTTERGLLSVVIPVYNVERYLGAAVDSVLDQNYKFIEVIIVDDGSTDASGRIADEYAARDRRVRVVHQANAGLGAARNAGHQIAVGEYLAFFDSDDVVEPDAYAYAVSVLKATGSDFTVAPYRFLVNGRLRNPGHWIARAHAIERRGVNLEQFPDIQANAVAWSKVYRRSFFDEHVRAYPTDVAYEDQVPATLSYMASSRFDVLVAPIVQWRIRESGSSITQGTASVTNLYDRVRVARDVLSLLHSHGRDEARLERIVQFLESDHLTLPRLAEGDDKYWSLVVEAIRELLPLVPREMLMRRISAQYRVVLKMIEAGDRQSVVDFLNRGGLNVLNWVFSEDESGLIVGRNPEIDLPGYVPKWSVVTANWQMQIQARLERADQEEDGSLVLRGFAYLAGLEAPPGTLEMVARDSAGGTQIQIEIEAVPTELAGELTAHRHLDYRDAGWIARVPAEQISALVASARSADVALQLVVAVGRAGVLAMSPVRTVAAALERSLPRVVSMAGSTVALTVTPGEGVMLRLGEGDLLPVEYARVDAQDLTIRLPSGTPLEATTVLIENAGALRPAVWKSAADVVTVRLPDDVPLGARVAFERFGRRRYLAMPSEASSVGTREITAGPLGELTVAAAGRRIELLDLNVAEDRILVELRSSDLDVDRLTVRLEGQQTVLEPETVDTDGARITAAFAGWRPQRGPWQPQTIPGGEYRIRVEQEDDAAGRPTPVNVVHGRELGRVLPLVDLGASAVKAELVGDGAFGVVLRISTADWCDALSPAQQQRRRTRYRESSFPLREFAYMQCLRGDQVNDSQLAMASVLRAREVPVVWGVVDRSVRVPEGDRQVIVDSEEYFEALGSARLLCYNHELPEFYVKRDGQVVVQTYHGHPFKMMGMGRWQALAYSEAQIRLSMDWRRTWDLLLSPSPLASRLYRENYPLDYRIAEVGQPRNDRIANADDSTRSRIRESLGIAGDTTAVLYAPTWRDYLASDPWASEMVDHVDPEWLVDRLGPEYTLLWRAHPAHGRHRGYRRSSVDRVVDVTYHPDVSDLIIASDVGVFDYSSIRFDFGVTGRPMIFFVPDKEQFFKAAPSLFPYDETTPGPQVATGEQLVGAIRGRAAWAGQFAEAYSEFRGRYTPYDDGRASIRAVEEIMGFIDEAHPGHRFGGHAGGCSDA